MSEQTGVPCFVAYYRRYLPYFKTVKDLVRQGTIGKVLSVQLNFSCPPRDLDYQLSSNLPWRLQTNISGGGYFYDLAPHQLDLMQDMFGIIMRAHGYCTNRGGLYAPEDTVNAVFEFEGGLSGSGSWCFVAHDSARKDRIEVVGDLGMLSFSVYEQNPIELHTSEGKKIISVNNPTYVQLPIIRSVIEDIQGIGVCKCTSVSATPTNWVMDRILGKL